MLRYFLSIRGVSIVAALFLAGFTLSACGGSGGAGDEVSITTGSLSKAEFIKRADAICASAKSRFSREYTAFVQEDKALFAGKAGKAAQAVALEKIVNEILVPNFQRAVDGISSLGAPKADERPVTAFLSAVEQRLGELEETPSEATESAAPFGKAEKLARAYGLTGCAESFH